MSPLIVTLWLLRVLEPYGNCAWEFSTVLSHPPLAIPFWSGENLRQTWGIGWAGLWRQEISPVRCSEFIEDAQILNVLFYSYWRMYWFIFFIGRGFWWLLTSLRTFKCSWGRYFPSKYIYVYIWLGLYVLELNYENWCAFTCVLKVLHKHSQQLLQHPPPVKLANVFVPYCKFMLWLRPCGLPELIFLPGDPLVNACDNVPYSRKGKLLAVCRSGTYWGLPRWIIVLVDLSAVLLHKQLSNINKMCSVNRH